MALHFTKSILNFSKTIFDFSKLISRFSKVFSHFSKSSVCFIKWSSCSHGSRLRLLAALSASCLLVLLFVWILTIRCGAMAPPLVASCGTRYKVGQKGPAIFLKMSCVVLQFQKKYLASWEFFVGLSNIMFGQLPIPRTPQIELAM